MSPSIWQLLIVLVIVIVVFGAKRLRNLGSDLGTAVKGFKTAVREADEEEEEQSGPGGGERLGRSGEEGEDHRFAGEDERREDVGARK